jgi:hypothetical protein
LLSPQAVRAKFTIKVDSTLIDFALAQRERQRGQDDRGVGAPEDGEDELLAHRCGSFGKFAEEAWSPAP